MREWLNAILLFIEADSLTDAEYDSINFLNITQGEYNQAAYDELAKVLAARELVSNAIDRLGAFFTAKGLKIAPLDKAVSNILLGLAL